MLFSNPLMRESNCSIYLCVMKLEGKFHDNSDRTMEDNIIISQKNLMINKSTLTVV